MYISKKVYLYVVAALICLVIAACAGLIASSLMQTVKGDNHAFSIIITILIGVFSLMALGLISFSIKAASRKPIEEISLLLNRFRDENSLTLHSSDEVDEISVALEGMMNELHRLLQSVQGKAQSVDRSVEELLKGIHQVAADQNNLFSLNAAIETVRARHDGFSVISGEILALVERTSHLTKDIREMSSQLRMGVNEIAAELEQVLRRVDPRRLGSLTDMDAKSAVQEKGREGIAP